MRCLVFLCLFFLNPVNAQKAVWQWSTELDKLVSEETNENPMAFLWIPENREKINGLIFTQHNMIEEGMMEHSYFRSKMRDLGFAIIWVTPFITQTFNFHDEAPKKFKYAIEKLAHVSGYKELKTVPVVPLGHSALASFPWNFAAWKPERTLAAISVHGDTPLTDLTGSGRPNPEWGKRNIDGVPGLFIMGEYEWMPERIEPAYDYISKNPNSVITLFVDAGHGHFDYSDMMVKYVVDYIEKAAQYRLSERGLGVPKLKKIKPEDGWLMDKWRKDSLPVSKAAPYSKFTGDKFVASWVFDREMAEETENFYAEARGKEEQYIGFKQNGEILSPNNSHTNYDLNFEPLKDGISFNLKAFFTDSTRLNPVEHHASTPLLIDKITGPVKKINDTTFQISFDKLGFNNIKRSNDIWLLAYNKGDKKYKSAVQQLNLRIPLKNTNGASQVINFPKIPDQKQGTVSLKLKASSSADVDVKYYIKKGPAYIKDDKLFFTKIPPDAKFPVELTVVAWQYGIPGKLQSAAPVERSFLIEKKTKND